MVEQVKDSLADRAEPSRPELRASAASVDLWLPSLYDCLKDIARRRLQYESPGHTLQPTALVHEAYVRLRKRGGGDWRNRAHFLSTAACAVREILVDHGRRRATAKRGGKQCRVALEDAGPVEESRTVDILMLDDALTRLAEAHKRAARVVELRFFGGLTTDESAALLNVSASTIKSDWRFARAWLHHALDTEVWG